MKKLIIFLSLIVCLASCRNDSDPEQGNNVDSEKVKRTIIVYAANQSDLSYDFTEDCNEMLKAMKDIDLTQYQLLLFYSESTDKSGLYQSVYNSNSRQVEFRKIRSYNRTTTTTDPTTISTVISDALDIFPNSKYDLIFWGHGMSWYPYFTGHDKVEKNVLYSYGGEYNGGRDDKGKLTKNWTEIDELSSAVPDHVFDTIWFDCCYMSGIEVIYEFKDKCNYFVGYPTEVWEYGLPYDLVLPELFTEQHNLINAASVFYDYYNNRAEPVTVSVCDMSKIETVADIAQSLERLGNNRPNKSGLLNYSRSSEVGMYDFRQYYSMISKLNNIDELNELLNSAMNEFVVYHAESSKNFNGKIWDVNNISGISVHYDKISDTPAENYYRTLKWYKRTR